MLCRNGWKLAVSVVLVESCFAIHLDAELENVQIGPHGNAQVLASRTQEPLDKDQPDGSIKPARSGLSSEDGIAKKVMREEKAQQHHHKGTMLERSVWARRHGNLYATHRLLRRNHAFAAMIARTMPRGIAIVWQSGLIYVFGVLLFIGFVVTVCVCCIQMRFDRDGDGLNDATEDADGGTGQTTTAGNPVERDLKCTPDPLAQDLYGMGIAAIIRDSQRFAQKTEALALRVSRLSISLMVLIFCMTLQVFLLCEMKSLVTVASNKEAQETYDSYEQTMYANNTWKLSNGHHRGTEGHFDIANFNHLSDDMKDAACQIPLSQPTFFIAILLTWTLVCFSEIRAAFDIFGSLVITTPTIASMKDCMTETAVEDDEAFVVVGLTRPVKMAILVITVIPRLIVSIILLWLGCRWLTGTFSFSDVMQNGVALSFILLLKDSFYATVVPHHNKQETENTMIMPLTELRAPSKSVFLGSFTWGLFAIGWVLLYITKLQQVLPEYQWDIHDACVEYLLDVERLTPGS